MRDHEIRKEEVYHSLGELQHLEVSGRKRIDLAIKEGEQLVEDAKHAAVKLVESAKEDGLKSKKEVFDVELAKIESQAAEVVKRAQEDASGLLKHASASVGKAAKQLVEIVLDLE